MSKRKEEQEPRNAKMKNAGSGPRIEVFPQSISNAINRDILDDWTRDEFLTLMDDMKQLYKKVESEKKLFRIQMRKFERGMQHLEIDKKINPVKRRKLMVQYNTDRSLNSPYVCGYPLNDEGDYCKRLGFCPFHVLDKIRLKERKEGFPIKVFKFKGNEKKRKQEDISKAFHLLIKAAESTNQENNQKNEINTNKNNKNDLMDVDTLNK